MRKQSSGSLRKLQRARPELSTKRDKYILLGWISKKVHPFSFSEYELTR